MQRRWLFGFTFPGTMSSYPLRTEMRLKEEFDVQIHQQPCSVDKRLFTASKHQMLRESKWGHYHGDVESLNGEHELYSVMKPTELDKELMSKGAQFVRDKLGVPTTDPGIIVQLRTFPDKVVRSQYRWDPALKVMKKDF
eukprot:TRINITY_DN37389_c0_g1_i1.p1 TRINITY_DN37389_c0_g1~~TRINITY_DN37389_c0_g1_i1.p1  ORF type:complete len:139 (+),score=23.25 TRINITY_DN37389_c0_g1_i1:30-446(+)